MSEQPAVATPVSRGWTLSRTAIRVLLLLAAFVLLREGDRQFFHLMGDGRVGLFSRGSLPDWVGWIGLLAASGFAFGLAGWLPRRFGYHPLRALLLGTVPLLMLIHYTLALGPSWVVRFSERHLGLAGWHLYFFDNAPRTGVAYALALMLGAAIASGFSTES